MKTKSLVVFLVTTLILKILLACYIPVFGDEAYYYIWSLHPQLSYFDHPPMVSWFIRIGHLFFPEGHALSLRIVFIIAGFITSLVWLKIFEEKHANPEQKISFLTLLFLNPLLGVGSILATPDVPLVLFWSLSYYSFLKIMSSQKLSWYAYLGLFLGLGFCSKYHIVIFVLSGLIYLLFSKNYQKLRWPGVLITIGLGAYFSLPVVVWNAQNNWSSFLFQLNHGLGEETFEWSWPLGYLIAQFLIVNPFVFFQLFRRTENATEKTFSISQLGFFFYSSFKSVVEGNWPITSHLHSLSHFVANGSKKLFRRAVIYWCAFYVLIFGFLISSASEKVRKNMSNSAQLEDIYPLIDIYKPLYGPSYQVASLMTWKTQQLVPKLRELSRHDFFDSLPESLPTALTFYVIKYDYSSWPRKYEIFEKRKIQSFDNLGLELYQLKYE